MASQLNNAKRAKDQLEMHFRLNSKKSALPDSSPPHLLLTALLCDQRQRTQQGLTEARAQQLAEQLRDQAHLEASGQSAGYFKVCSMQLIHYSLLGGYSKCLKRNHCLRECTAPNQRCLRHNTPSQQWQAMEQVVLTGLPRPACLALLHVLHYMHAKTSAQE